MGQVASAFFDKGKISIDSVLGVIPMGSGCDYFRSLWRTSPWDIITRGQTMLVDVVRAKTEEQDIVSVNTLSAGITAEIVANKETLPFWVPSLRLILFRLS